MFELSGCSRAAAPPPTITDTVSWINPTQTVDGRPLKNLAFVRVMWGRKGGPYTAGARAIPAPATSCVIRRPATPGTVCYVLVAVDSASRESKPSPEVCKTVAR
jgi:hypothetical protein